MEELLLDIIEAVRARGELSGDELARVILDRIKRIGAERSSHSKRRLLPYYFRVKRDEPERWASWRVTPELEGQLVRTLRVKPQRTASGVATVSVITRPAPCSSNCLYCPCDVRMPKSYLHAEPACARAERAFFDPYLQATARLRALSEMGHPTDKVELIVLGGTWTDYPEGYQVWFVRELFRALNEFGSDAGGAPCGSGEPDGAAGEPGRVASPAADKPARRSVCQDPVPQSSVVPSPAVSSHVVPSPVALPLHSERERRAFYEACGIACEEDGLAAFTAEAQRAVDAGELGYNEAVRRLYGGVQGEGSPWQEVAACQSATWEELEREQRVNEVARHRAVGLVIETRPDAVTPDALLHVRRLGCTKVQMGVQSLDRTLLARNGRRVLPGTVERAFGLLRLFGFKVHAHFMLNLLGATPEGDKCDYRRFATEPAYQPDEVKLYPCSLVAGTGLVRAYEQGEWRPYTESELMDVLCADVLATPAFTRVSRMIRDISACDILVGNKKANLRQEVERELARRHARVREIRSREIRLSELDTASLSLDVVPYETPETSERFLQWVTPEGRIAGFLRLSLPRAEAVARLAAQLEGSGERSPIALGDAMIREVHVYGMSERLGETGAGAQHAGLGRALVERACDIARRAGYRGVNVISAVGTRGYYRRLGFEDAGLYQRKDLAAEKPVHVGDSSARAGEPL